MKILVVCVALICMVLAWPVRAGGGGYCEGRDRTSRSACDVEGIGELSEVILSGQFERAADVPLSSDVVNMPTGMLGGETPFNYVFLRAIEDRRYLPLLKRMLSYRPNIDGLLPSGLGTPLRVALIQGNYEVAEILLEHGASPNLPIGIRCPLVSAVTGDGPEQNKVKAVKLLVRYGASIERSSGGSPSEEVLLEEYFLSVVSPSVYCIVLPTAKSCFNSNN